jgi:hypothetical protein
MTSLRRVDAAELTIELATCSDASVVTELAIEFVECDRAPVRRGMIEASPKGS